MFGIEYLELSTLYASALVPEGKFCTADLRSDIFGTCSIDENKFDMVVHVEVYEHIPPEDCPAVLSNLYRALKPGGQLIISVPTKDLALSNLHYRHFDLDEITGELEAVGFVPVKTIGQHRLNKFSRLLLHKRLEALLHNKWIQSLVVKEIWRRSYLKFCNSASPNKKVGRYIIIAIKEPKRSD